MASNAKKKAGAARPDSGGPPGGAPGQPVPASSCRPARCRPARCRRRCRRRCRAAMQGGMQGGYPAGGAMAYQGPMSGGGPPPGGAAGLSPSRWRAGPSGSRRRSGVPGRPGSAGLPRRRQPPMNGGIVVTGMLWWKKHLCAQCGQQLDKTWDRCPYCTQARRRRSPRRTRPRRSCSTPPAPEPASSCAAGWWRSRGRSAASSSRSTPVTSVGTDPGCTIVLERQLHVVAPLRDPRRGRASGSCATSRSTNGTYVNDKRIEQHELVDSDFIKLGQSVMKFKSL